MDRYLPVGTVCTINNTNVKYVIIGYFSLEYNYNVKLYDYIGLPYPEGFLKKNKINSFNHSDITNIEHLGLINDDFENFNNIMCESSIEENNEKSLDGLFSNFTFDENGVVIYEYKSEEPVESKIIMKDSVLLQETESVVENPFNKIEDYDNEINIVDKPEQWEIFKKIEFDENGVVIELVEE